jgi:hypothetical protein
MLVLASNKRACVEIMKRNMFLAGMKRKDAPRELILIALLGLAVFAASARYNILEKFVAFSRQHERWNLDEILISLSALFVGLLVFSIRRWLELARSERELDRRNKALSSALSEIRSLRGILPICASCKSIRDDQGYWHQVESYLLDHSEIEFSHGICPECKKRLYPEFCEADTPATGNSSRSQ